MIFNYRGKTFNIDGISQEDHILKSIIANNTFYEADLLEYMRSMRKYLCTEDSIAIDVGANIGNHSIFFQTFIVSHVIAVEPNPTVLPILERNLQANIKNYTIYKNALGESKGQGAVILTTGSEANVGMARIESSAAGGEIDILTLDSLVADWLAGRGEKNVAMIKIDVEGMELDVLKGARNTLIKYRPQLFLEAATLEEFDKLNNYLREFGYQSMGCWAATPVYHFCYKPSYGLRSAVKYEKLKQKIKFLQSKHVSRFKLIS